ncbi:ParB/RepB/Spo0J family partition protein [Palleronia sediminis]|uniref:ParB/RepB/Spo0J family partition protein n=2 Tax=Palleronia sediminis TaxID=2547833 RepID=A0A4R6A6L0_9RHOB|nr:ParB/RepB/Spo0J family partition protein [Palleronia sediminis]
MADVSVDEIPGAERRQAETTIPIERIAPNPDQPRRSFAPEALQELADSISAKGVIQPLVVRRHPEKAGHYQIVAGERRWRAAQMAKLHELPALVRDFDDTEVLEIAIIENIQRADLTAVDEARGYRQLMDRFGRTQEQMADALGKSRSHIANMLRLLTLPPAVQDHLDAGRLSAGHARALVTAADPASLADEVIAANLTVRQTEDRVRKAKAGQSPRQERGRANGDKDADTRALERDLSTALGLRITIDHKPGGESGTMTISYKHLAQLDDLCRLLSRDVF